MAHASVCSSPLTDLNYPREINTAQTFENLVQWIHDELIVNRGAPGLVVGISGTDSIVAFLACARAFELAGKPDRVSGVHFAPSEEMDPTPEQLWFQNEVIPWLRQQAPHAQIVIDTSIDYRRDGLRWGALMDWSVISNPSTRAMRPASEQFWVVGTRNATEERLFTYSNASTAVSVQVLTQLWKSEILQISKYLGVPEVAMAKSCDVDCACGRGRLAALHITEVDWMLMAREGLLSDNFVQTNIPPATRGFLAKYIESQIASTQFKSLIPYKPIETVIDTQAPFNRAQVVDAKRLSQLVPDIIAKGQANVASDLVASPTPNGQDWLPEQLALFNTRGLRSTQKKQMIKGVFGVELPMNHDREATELTKINGRLGNYGFSFPQWRYLTQRYGETPTLAEQFGMTPESDRWGRGFKSRDGDWTIEYHRAYILVSDNSASTPATLVIRNSSHFFGRDQLKNAVYVSFKPRGESENPESYVRWQDLLRQNPELSIEEKIKRVSRLLDRLDTLNDQFGQWFKTPAGLDALTKFLAKKAPGTQQPSEPPLYLAVVDGHVPSWQPHSATALTPTLDVAQFISGISGRGRLILMSGPNGDYP